VLNFVTEPQICSFACACAPSRVLCGLWADGGRDSRVGGSTRLCGGGPGCSCSSPTMSFFARRLRLRFQRGVYIAAIRLSQGIRMMQNGFEN
jgi:hypothetical protein